MTELNRDPISLLEAPNADLSMIAAQAGFSDQSHMTMRVGFHGEDTPQIYVFFEVPDMEEAIALVREAGGEADPPAPEEPGFGRCSNYRDPQGIRFGLHEQTSG